MNWRCGKTKQRCVLNVLIHTSPCWKKLTALLGRQPELPDWIYDGVTLGIQGGTEVCQKKLDTMRNAGVKVNGIWAQDWSGIRMTSFGKRVMWNWKWNSENYPQLDSRIKQWNKEGVQFGLYQPVCRQR